MTSGFSTIFNYINEKKNPQKTGTENLEVPKVHNYGPPRQPKIFQTIPEVENDDDIISTISSTDLENDNKTRVSFTRKERKISDNGSRSSGRNKTNYNNGNENYIQRGVGRGTARSSQASTRSLPVLKEQYCCCTRWSRFEKNLVTAVAILAFVIIGLAIAVGILAGDDGADPSYWKL